MDIARDMKTIEVADVVYQLVGKPEDMPLGIVYMARKLEQGLLAAGDDAEAQARFHAENLFTLCDIVFRTARFALGEKQYGQAEDAILMMSRDDFFAFGTSISKKYEQVLSAGT